MHKALTPKFVQRPTVEMLNHLLNLRVKACALLPGVASLVPARPQGLDDNRCLWPDLVDLLDETNVGGHELRSCNVIGGVVVIGPDVDYDDVGGRLLGEVPAGWI